ncbi:phenolphthiocerol synthesis polyketide synthase type I Pks15/1 [Austrofundulus limnaeus]|uniref:Phenolphthiocerol synthesis polyketide synthase type I Pks15/1 n=1 Tax=Austrofundulus limnaeus TaxID=52670 RepID=A0A2I4AZH7_AUSLI|nr:PREDICTED: phenolphthiocerol synthesis polyketide synthase type I Pks15/1-like [Austrofundulus limnaeus]
MEDAEDNIAVIGMGCNFPGGEGLDKFWKVLQEGKNCVADIPAERFDTNFWYNVDVNQTGKTQTTKAALIEGFNDFDHMFFGIAEVEADSMDPQQKLLLQCTYRALEDAGIAMESISGSRTGVYIGLMNRDYEMIRNNNSDSITHFNGTGTAMSMAANKISFIFNLTGPSFVLDSACSSSLVALHVACQAIKQGDCEMALCGGVNCIMEPRVFVALSKAKMISPEGTSKPFSISADGYGRGEGCGVILLKPLRKAIKDFNKIWGIVCKTAVNQDGHSTTPITKPSMTQQEELLRRIYSDSDIANVQYIEAHGTGTPAGDPIEAGSISNVIAKAKPPGSKTLLTGSVKGNIGHTESAAGVAGLIKVLLMMKHKTIVTSVFYSNCNSSVDVNALNLHIPSKTERWEATGSMGRVAGVNSFGFGGTNAHVILREHSHEVAPTKAWPKLFVLSASSEKSLVLTISDTHQRLCNNPSSDLQRISYTSACRRSHSKNKFRKAFITNTLPDLKQQLKSELKTKFESVKPDVQLVFVFCGNGVSYWGMCRQLMREVPAFREKVREVENAFQTHQTINISRLLAGECDNTNLSQPNVVQPLLFSIQVGIATLLMHWGVKPNVMLGHSVGEVAAAHCSGLLSLEDAVKVLYHRSTLQSKVTGGKMLVVSNVAVTNVLEVLSAFSGKISVAAYNSPQSCTLSGDAEAVDTLHERLMLMFADKNLFLHVLDVSAAYHSHMMDPVLEDIESSIGLLGNNYMECELFSTVTGKRCSDGDFTSGTYWAKNIQHPVLFDQALHAATKDQKSKGNMVFVEIGPRRALQRYICETLGDDTKVFSSVQPEKDCDSISSTLASLFVLGINVKWNEVYKGCETLPTTLPVYQFVNTKKNVNFEALRRGHESSAVSHHRVMSQIKEDKKKVIYDLSFKTAPYLWEHKNNNVPIVPGALYVELAYSTVMANLKPKKPVSQLRLSVTFESVLTLNLNSQQMKVSLEQSEREASFQIQSSVATHALGTFRYTDQQPLLEEAVIGVDVIYRRCKLVMRREEVYSLLSQLGFEYGPLFKQLDKVCLGNEFNEAITTFQVPAELQKNLHEYAVHPVILDYFMQMTSVIAMRQQAATQGFPSQIASMAISGPLQNDMIMYLRATEERKDFLDVCGCFSTTDGKVLVELKGVRISFLNPSSNAPQSLFFQNETVGLATEIDVQDGKIKAIIFEDQLGIAKGLRPYLCPESIFVKGRKKLTSGEIRNLVFDSLNSNEGVKDIIYMWGVEDLSHLSPERILECFVICCEMFRQIVLAVKESKCSCAIRVITYRSTETTVDHVSSAFVLCGMLRACSAEMAGLHFQLVDLASVTVEDIRTLARVIKISKQQEVRVNKGQVSSIRIAQTTVKDRDLVEGETHSVDPRDFVLQTTDPFQMANLSAIPANMDVSLVQEQSVEIQLTNMCIHSSDFFPVSTSHLNFGETLYWNRHVTQNHKVLALDFSGIVTFVGKHVQNLKVGDHIASCYPAIAATKIVIPEAVCYGTKTLPFLKETPCVSYFILAWEVLQKLLSEVKKMDKKLAIISSNSASTLMKVLALTASRSGWNVSSRAQYTGELSHFDAFVFLPPFDHSFEGMCNNGGLGKHIIFVWSSHMSPLTPTSGFAPLNDDVHVHNLDVACVLQRANLQAQNRNISNWLVSLGFEAASLPLRGELNQTKLSESYFMTTTVQQVVFNREGCDLPTSDNHLLTNPRQLFKQYCVYVVTGGLSGLGFETVRFIAQNGGGCITILSRRAPSDDIQFEIDLLQKRFGVKILNVQCDVSASLQVVKAISKIEQKFPSCPIKGVFHSAAVLHDALIESLDESLFRKVLKPKVSGALNLHFATLHNKLDFFVCYSSISSFIGNASQCNYSAANSFLDTFCHYRRNLGLAGQSINWGPLNLGLLLNKNHFQKFLETKGLMTMGVCEVHETLKQCLLMNRPQQVICKFNFKNLNLHVLSQNSSLRERLSTLVESMLKDETHEEPKVHLSSSTQETLKMIVGEILSVSAAELDDNISLSALGIDSMLAMTLQNKIYQETGVNVPLVVLLDHGSTLGTLVSVVNSG